MSLPAVHPGNSLSLATVKADTALAIHAGGKDFFVTPKDIIEWVAPTAPMGEAKKFLVICQTLSLNPLLGEADLASIGGKWQTIIRKNGYIKCARNDPSYDGHEAGVTVQAFSKNNKNVNVKHGPFIDLEGGIVPEGHLLVGGWCKMFRKGISRPFYKRVSITEFDKGSGAWVSNKCTMIAKVAIAHAAREAIDLLSATYDESELDRVQPAPQQGPPVQATVVPQLPTIPNPTEDYGKGIQDWRGPKPSGPNHMTEREWEPGTATIVEGERPPITPEQIEEIRLLCDRLKMSDYQYAKMLEKREVFSLEDLDTFDAGTILSTLRSKASVAEWEPLGGNAESAPEAQTKIAESPADAEIIEAEIQEIPEKVS